jgi:hypothetical protein
MFNGGSGLLKLYMADGSMRHVWHARDVGIGNEGIGNADQYGHYCKVPPGIDYVLGAPQFCGPNSDHGAGYGWWFTPINDNAAGTLAEYGRAGLGLHGGGSGSPAPFSAYQGWYDTLGCIRLQNADNGMEEPAPGTLVAAVQYIQRAGGTVYLDVVWP